MVDVIDLIDIIDLIDSIDILWNLDEALSSPLPGKQTKGFRSLRYSDHERANRSCSTVLTARISSICWRQPSSCNASRHRHTHPYNTVIDIINIIDIIESKSA